MTAAAVLATPPIAPGLHLVPEQEYHAQSWAMSSTGARHILPPSCPAIARWKADNPEFKPEFDEGSAAHRLVLGAGPDVVELDYASWQFKGAKEDRKQARAEGKVALLSKELARVRRMVDAVHAHPIAGALFGDDDALREHSVFWRDGDSGVECRAMLDLLRLDGRRAPLAVDLKTTTSVDPASIAKAVANHGYHQQDQWYSDGVESLGVDRRDLGFVFVFVAKDPPHLVTVVQLDPDAADVGWSRNRRARELWARCVADNAWPPFSLDIEPIGLPRWAPL